ncbi:MAG: hypothetical protein DMF62_12825 [Acidobacteria bacterium]|nr:MAG: hypothetical protein DMF62_12825 [Acidobacteriota bacterium]
MQSAFPRYTSRLPSIVRPIRLCRSDVLILGVIGFIVSLAGVVAGGVFYSLDFTALIHVEFTQVLSIYKSLNGFSVDDICLFSSAHLAAPFVPFVLAAFPAREFERPEEILAENEHFITQLTAAMPDILYVFDYEDRSLIYLNDQSSAMLGYSKAEISEMGATIIETLVYPDDLQKLPRLISRYSSLNDGEILEHEYRVRHKEGDWRWLRSRDVIFKRKPDGKAAQILAIAHDITDRKLINEALVESEERNASILSALPDLMFIQSEDGTYLDYHAQDPSLLLVPPNDFLGRNMREILPPEMIDGIEDAFRQAKETGKPARSEYAMSIDGHESFYEYRTVWSADERFFTIVRDITEQKRAHRALAESEARFRAQYRGIPIPTFTWKMQGDDFVLADFNDDAFCASNGLIGDLIGSHASHVFKDSREILESLEKCLKKKVVVERRQVSGFLPNQHNKFFDMTCVYVPPDMIMMHAEDVTTRKLDLELLLAHIEQLAAAKREIAEQNLRLNDSRLEVEGEKQRFWDLFEFAPGGYLTTNSDGVIAEANQAALELLAAGNDGLKGLSIDSFICPSDRNAFIAFLETLRERPYAAEGELVMLRGAERFNASIKAIAYHFHEKVSVRWLLQDITERKRVAEALADSEEKYRRIVDTMLEGIWVVDSEFRITLANKQLSEMLGYADDEMLGRNAAEFVVDKTEADFEEIKSHRLQGLSEKYDIKLRCKDGSDIWVLVSATPILENGDFRGSLAMITDITERKQAEESLRNLSARLLNLQDEERRRIARELHDETAQNLAIVNVNLSAFKNMLSENEKAEALLTQTEMLNQRSLQEVRTLSYLLHPPMLDERGLLSALRWLIRGFSERSGITVELIEKVPIGRLSMDIETALYRVVQESLTNIDRHSGSQTGLVELKKLRSRVEVSIKDNGRGFSGISDQIHDSLQSLGVGILGMRERLRLLGGTLEVVSDSTGTTVTGSIPLVQN